MELKENHARTQMEEARIRTETEKNTRIQNRLTDMANVKSEPSVSLIILNFCNKKIISDGCQQCG